MKKYSVFAASVVFFVSSLFFGTRAYAAISLVNHGSSGDVGEDISGNTGYTLPWNPVAGDLLAVGECWNTNTPSHAITKIIDTYGNSYTTSSPIGGTVGASHCEWAWSLLTQGGPSFTVTSTVPDTNGSNAELYVSEWSGVSAIKDTESEATGTANPDSTGAMITHNNHDLILGIFNDFAQGSPYAYSPGNTFTELDNANPQDPVSDEYLITNTPGTYSATSSEDGIPFDWAAAGLALKDIPGSTYGYAWGNKMGWVNFGTSLGNLTVYTTTVQGYAWSQNFGWINFGPFLRPISLVQATSTPDNFTNTTATIAFGSPTTAGDLIIASVGTQNASTTISDTAGNTWAVATSTSCSGSSCAFDTLTNTVYYAANIKGGADSINVYPITSDHVELAIFEYSGLATSSPVDQTNGNVAGTATSINTGSTTISQANELLFSSVMLYGVCTTTPTVSSGWTMETDNFASVSNTCVITADQPVSSINTYSNTFGGLPAGTAGIATNIVTFKGVAAIPGVQNDGYGNLSGDAWSQGTGYINFSGVHIDTGGVLHGIASGTVAGSLVFDSSSANCIYCNVSSTWKAPQLLAVSGVSVNQGNNITLTADATTSVQVGFQVTDTNGCSSVFGSGTTTVVLYRGGVGSSCTANNANCYTTTSVVSSCSGGSGSTVNATATIPMYYFAQSTGAGQAQYPSDHWYASVTAQDATTASAVATSTAVDVNVLTAMNVTTSSINYGNLSPGANTNSTNQQTAIQNAGNSSTSLELDAVQTLVSGSNIFATSSQHYATSSFTYNSNDQLLSDSATTVSGFVLSPPTSTVAVQSPIYWGLGIPGGAASGTYSGVNQFIALLQGTYGNGYANRKTITVSSTLISPIAGTALSDFPMLISGTYPYLAASSSISASGTLQNANGYDVIFTSDSAGNIPLNYQVESYSSSTGAVNYWVQVPTLSSSSNQIYMFYDNPSIAATQSNASATWSGNYDAVWHLDEATGDTSTDSTANGYNAYPIVAPVQTAGKIAGSLSFNGTTQWEDTLQPLGNFMSANTGTVEAWAYLTGTPAVDCGQLDGPPIFTDGDEGDGGFGYMELGASDDGSWCGGINNTVIEYPYALNTWTHLVYVHGNGEELLYVNGVLEASSSVGGVEDLSGKVDLGMGYDGNAFFPGQIDEVRASMNALSPDWIKTEYNNQSSPSTFYSIL